MARYVDGFLFPIAGDKLEAYRDIASKAGAVWMEHGALQYVEAVGDDLAIDGVRPFPDAAGARAGETLVFAWIVYESREHRDRVNAAVMADPRLQAMMNPETHPLDPKRMAYGGFRAIVDL